MAAAGEAPSFKPADATGLMLLLLLPLLKLLLAGCFTAPPTPQSSQSEEAVVEAAGEAPSFKPADATGLMMLLLPPIVKLAILPVAEETAFSERNSLQRSKAAKEQNGKHRRDHQQ